MARIHHTMAEWSQTSRSRPNFNNIGIVGVHHLAEDNFNRWKSIQIGIAFNKLAIYNQRSRVAANHTNSLLSVFALQANGYAEDQLSDALPYTSSVAYQAYAVDPTFTGATSYTHQFANADTIFQNHVLERKGGMNETVIAVSGNYDGKVFIGASIGFPRIKFDEAYLHSETKIADSTTSALTSFGYSFDLQTRGYGINGKIGLIYVPTSYLRLGLAVHTPTRFALNDRWQTSMNSSL